MSFLHRVACVGKCFVVTGLLIFIVSCSQPRRMDRRSSEDLVNKTHKKNVFNKCSPSFCNPVAEYDGILIEFSSM